MSFGVKKSLKLCRQYGCIARFCISCNAKPCLNPPKTRHTSQEIVNNVPYFGTVHNSWGSKVQYSEILVRRVCSISKGGLRDDEVVDDLEESSGSEAEEEPQTLKKKHGNMKDEGFVRNVDSILCILKGVEGLSPEARLALEKSGVFVSSDLVEEVLARVMNDWKSAYTVFLWAGSQQATFGGLPGNRRSREQSDRKGGSVKKWWQAVVNGSSQEAQNPTPSQRQWRCEPQLHRKGVNINCFRE